MICAGGHRKGACFVSFDNDSFLDFLVLLCQGDSGGPLTQDGILIGVVSGGDVTAAFEWFECECSQIHIGLTS